MTEQKSHFSVIPFCCPVEDFSYLCIVKRHGIAADPNETTLNRL